MRVILNNSEEDKIWKANNESRRKESVESQSPAIEEEMYNDFAAVISRGLGNGGGQSSLPEHPDTDTEEMASGNVEAGGPLGRSP